MQKNVPIIGFFLFLILIVIGAWYFFFVWPHSTGASAPAPDETIVSAFAPATSTPAAPESPLEAPRSAPEGFREYRNTAYRFELFYPNNLRVEEFDEGSGARTLTFQDVKSAHGFQIFVVPYNAQQVTPERFKMDSPSGVMRDPENLSIDGAFATMFIGQDQFLGPTREVWFINGGYLYEVTAPLPLDEWLGNIMLTWQFI